jgi:PAS domain S-box-containing protein
MLLPATPLNEAQRLEELCSLGVLDTPAEERFDRITRTAQTLFTVPIALISLIDQNRQWFKSKQGLAAEQTPRNISFCGHAILGDGAFVIENADIDPRFMDNPLVTAAPFVKFYAGIPLLGPKGNKLGTLCIIDNVPRHLDSDAIAALGDLAKWAEAELASAYASRLANARESQLFNILKHTVDGIFTVDEFDQIKEVNPAALSMFGYEEHALVGHNIKMLMTESYRSTQESFIQNYRRIDQAKLSSKDREMVGKRSDGTTFSIDVILSEMMDVIDEIPRYVVIIREISELKLAEKKLRESSRLLGTVMNSTTSFVHVRDLEGRYLYVNKEYETVFHCTNEDVTGKSYADVLPLELAQRVWESERAIIETGTTLHTETIVQREDGPHVYLVIRSPLLDENGVVAGTCGVGLDITQNKRLEKEMASALASLRTMDRIKTEFVSTVSHELRTPLTSIRGSLGLLEAGVLGELPVKALDMIKVANKNSQRLITLVNDILDMDKLLSGKMTMLSELVNFSEIVTQAVEANAAYAANYQVRFAVSPDTVSSTVMVIGDANRLMQVMTNLLSNAAKFSHPGDIVTIRQIKLDTFLRVEVEDRGEGIPIAFQPRIFEAFSQADSANTRRQGSTGLGLNISKKLIQKMGGEVGYITEINCGTTFWFTVPLAS